MGGERFEVSVELIFLWLFGLAGTCFFSVFDVMVDTSFSEVGLLVLE